MISIAKIDEDHPANVKILTPFANPFATIFVPFKNIHTNTK
jgi:hypothetical protein